MLQFSCRPPNARIEFREIKDFKHIVHFQSVESQKPCCLSTLGNSDAILGFAERKKKSFKLMQLKCDTVPPLPVNENDQLVPLKVEDMCLIQRYKEQLLIITNPVGLFAYSLSKKRTMWKAALTGMGKPMRLSSVASDGRMIVFACDQNNECVQVFSLQDGKYLGKLAGARGLGNPERILWFDQESSLFVAHKDKNAILNMNVVKVD